MCQFQWLRSLAASSVAVALAVCHEGRAEPYCTHTLRLQEMGADCLHFCVRDSTMADTLGGTGSRFVRHPVNRTTSALVGRGGAAGCSCGTAVVPRDGCAGGGVGCARMPRSGRCFWRSRRCSSRCQPGMTVPAMQPAAASGFRCCWVRLRRPPPLLPTSRDPPSLPCVHLHTHSGLLGTVRIVRASFRYLARSSSLFQFVQAFLGIVQIDPKQALHVEKVDDNEAKPILIAKQLNELVSVDNVTRLHWCDTGVLTIEVAAQPS